MYTEYFWYDGPLLYSVGTRSERYLFTALGDDDRSRATNTQPYLVVPMTSKREQDIFEDKLTLRQSVLHSGGKIFRTYDFGKTYEEVDLTSSDRESFLVEPEFAFRFVRSSGNIIAENRERIDLHIVMPIFLSFSGRCHIGFERISLFPI